MAKLDRLERRKDRKGSLSLTQEDKRQALLAAQEADRLSKPVSQAAVDTEAGRAAQLAGQAGQAAMGELAGAALGGTSVQQGALGRAAQNVASGTAETVAKARLGARDLLENMRERRRDKAMDRVSQRAQFQQQLRKGYYDSSMQSVGSVVQAVTELFK